MQYCINHVLKTSIYAFNYKFIVKSLDDYKSLDEGMPAKNWYRILERYKIIDIDVKPKSFVFRTSKNKQLSVNHFYVFFQKRYCQLFKYNLKIIFK